MKCHRAMPSGCLLSRLIVESVPILCQSQQSILWGSSSALGMAVGTHSPRQLTTEELNSCEREVSSEQEGLSVKTTIFGTRRIKRAQQQQTTTTQDNNNNNKD